MCAAFLFLAPSPFILDDRVGTAEARGFEDDGPVIEACSENVQTSVAELESAAGKGLKALCAGFRTTSSGFQAADLELPFFLPVSAEAKILSAFTPSAHPRAFENAPTPHRELLGRLCFARLEAIRDAGWRIFRAQRCSEKSCGGGRLDFGFQSP